MADYHLMDMLDGLSLDDPDRRELMARWVVCEVTPVVLRANGGMYLPDCAVDLEIPDQDLTELEELLSHIGLLIVDHPDEAREGWYEPLRSGVHALQTLLILIRNEEAPSSIIFHIGLAVELFEKLVPEVGELRVRFIDDLIDRS